MKGASLVAAMVLASAAATPMRAQVPGSFFDRLEAERAEQSGTAIAIIFDDSGSMGGDKITQAKKAFREWIAKVPASHRLGLIALNGGALVPLGRENRPALLAAVDHLQAGGGTPLVPNIRRGLAELEKRRGEVGPYERHIVLVFTDGQDTTSEGIPGVLQILESARRQGVETVGIGYHGEGDYMRSSATRYYDASNLAELQNSLAKVDAEIGDTSDIVINERTREAMKSVNRPLPSPVAAALVSPRDAAPAPNAPLAAPNKPLGFFPAAAIVVVVLWALSRIIKRARRQ